MSNAAIGTGVLHNGRVTWDDAVGLTDDLKLMPDGAIVVHISHATGRALRSARANRYYFFILGRIAKTLQIPSDDLDDLMAALFLARPITLTIPDTGESITVVAPRRPSRLGPREFAAFVDRVRTYAIDVLGIAIPLPSERDGDAGDGEDGS